MVGFLSEEPATISNDEKSYSDMTIIMKLL